MIGGLLFLALGVVLTCISFADYEDAVANEDIVTDLPVHEKEYDVFLMCLGVFFTIFGFVLLGECDDSMVTAVVLHNYCTLYRLIRQSG